MRKTPGVFTIRSSVEDTLAARRLSCVNATTETGTDWRRSSVRRAVTTMSSKPEFKGACFTSTVDGSRLAAAAAFCAARSEEHTSELQSLMRLTYADFCLK